MDRAHQEQVFRSVRHPGARSKPVVAGGALVRPLGFCMLPIMIGALVSMLQGFVALPWLTIGFPLATALALAWTWHAIRSRICEITVVGDRICARSEFDAAEPVSAVRWKWALDIQIGSRHADLTLGLSPIRLYREEWPEWEELVASLHWAHLQQPGAPSEGDQPNIP